MCELQTQEHFRKAVIVEVKISAVDTTDCGMEFTDWLLVGMWGNWLG